MMHYYMYVTGQYTTSAQSYVNQLDSCFCKVSACYLTFMIIITESRQLHTIIKDTKAHSITVQCTCIL